MNMKEVTYAQYEQELLEFTNKHNKNGELEVFTSPMAYGHYTKIYAWEDGANWFEDNKLIQEKIETEVELHGCTIKITKTVNFWKTEFWSTESGSKCFYQLTR